ncbi:NfeD family protein [Paenibacillus agilis]|uniref:Protease n=1 Tax=Paenibacillus agilis TaxID=3020863 RepID=A0A559IHW2_9BACL|nr:NfeD family protein [Paenibacillus agilis]TVX87043.1 protease [Paenibacillus agilis]
MEVLYWSLLILGIIYAAITLLFGDVWDAAIGEIIHIPFLQPAVLLGGLTSLGATGVLLTRYSNLLPWLIFVLSLCAAVVVSTIMYFFYIKSMEKSEHSIAFSLSDLIGSIAEVHTPIPAQGFGEIIIYSKTGATNQIAASFDGIEIPSNTKVVIIDVRDHTTYVSPMEELQRL